MEVSPIMGNNKRIFLIALAVLFILSVPIFTEINEFNKNEVGSNMDNIVGIGDPVEITGGDTPRPESFELPKGVQSYKVIYSESPLEDYKPNVTTVKNLGEFRIIRYSHKDMADTITYSGNTPTEKHTVAVDPDIIEIGSHILIDGNEYVAEDVNDLVKGNTVGIYESEEEDSQIYFTEVYLVED